MNMNGKIYKVFAVVTNIMSWSPAHIVNWQRGRCGKSEQIHHVLKEELAGDTSSQTRWAPTLHGGR